MNENRIDMENVSEGAREMIEKKVKLLEKKNFTNIEIIARGRFEARHCGVPHKLRLNDRMYLWMDKRPMGYIN